MTKSRLPPLPPTDFVCEECGYSYVGQSSHDKAILAIADAVRMLRLTLAEATADVHVRHAPTTWSIVEYVCHIRDVLTTSALRLHRIVHEDQPLLEPMYNDWRARIFRYNDEDPHQVLGQLERARDGFFEEVTSVPPTAWRRTGGRFAGEARSARWLVQHAGHELTHHLGDIRRLLGVATSLTPVHRPGGQPPV